MKNTLLLVGGFIASSALSLAVDYSKVSLIFLDTFPKKASFQETSADLFVDGVEIDVFQDENFEDINSDACYEYPKPPTEPSKSTCKNYLTSL